MEELIQQIQAKVNKKKVQSLCKKILKKLSFKSVRDLANVNQLASWLYIYGYYDEAIAVCDILKDMEFTGNYDLWNRADYAMCLKARILRERGEMKEREVLLQRVNEHRHPELYKNHIDWYRNTLEENIASDSGIYKGWELVKLRDAIMYREAGGFPIPDEEFENDISRMISILENTK